MQFSQEAWGQSSVPSFGMTASSVGGRMSSEDPVSRLYNMSPWSSFWYHHWQLVWRARQSGSGSLLPPVSSLLGAPEPSPAEGLECVDAVGTRPAAQYQSAGIANVAGDITFGGSSFGGLSSGDLSPGSAPPGSVSSRDLFDNFDSRSCARDSFTSTCYDSGSLTSDSYGSGSLTSDSYGLGSLTSDGTTSDSFASDSFTSDSLTSSSFTSGSFTPDGFSSRNIPLQTASEVELQQDISQSYRPSPSDFIDFGDALSSLRPTSDEIDHRHQALAATPPHKDSFSAYLDAEVMKMTPKDHKNLRELSLPTPRTESDVHSNAQTWPLPSGSIKNTMVLPEDRGDVACGGRDPHSVSHRLDPTSSPAQNGSGPLLQPLALRTVDVAKQPDKQPAKPWSVLLASEDEVSCEEEASSSLLLAAPAQRVVEPALFPQSTTPLPSLHSLDLLFCGAPSASGTSRASSALSTPIASRAPGAPGALSPRSETSGRGQAFAEEESALLRRMTDKDYSYWNTLQEEDQSLIALRATGMRWARTQSLWSARHGVPRSIGALKMRWRRLQDRLTWLSTLLPGASIRKASLQSGARKRKQRGRPAKRRAGLTPSSASTLLGSARAVAGPG